MKGFTLIELMIVIAIVGILAAILIPAFQGHSKAQNELRMNGCNPEIYSEKCKEGK